MLPWSQLRKLRHGAVEQEFTARPSMLPGVDEFIPVVAFLSFCLYGLLYQWESFRVSALNLNKVYLSPLLKRN